MAFTCLLLRQNMTWQWIHWCCKITKITLRNWSNYSRFNTKLLKRKLKSFASSARNLYVNFQGRKGKQNLSSGDMFSEVTWNLILCDTFTPGFHVKTIFYQQRIYKGLFVVFARRCSVFNKMALRCIAEIEKGLCCYIIKWAHLETVRKIIFSDQVTAM